MRTRKADPSRLKILRDDKWWTQEQLSKESGVSVPTIVNIEKGRTLHPQNQTLFALAKALGVNPTELLEPRAGDASRHDAEGRPPLYGTG